MGLIIDNSRLGAPEQKLYRLVVESEMARTARPGQFLHIRVADTPAPLLRRPLSIAGIDAAAGRLTLYYRLKGQGTELLARKRPGEKLDALGPLGRGFTVPAAGELLLIAGGVGVFPLLSLGEAAGRRGIPCALLWGGENSAFFAAAAGIAGHIPTRRYATMDGSFGVRGLVTELLTSRLAQPSTGGGLTAAACGPYPMLKAVAATARAHPLPLEVSLETTMACGIGACLGCALPGRDAAGGRVTRRVCLDGPVFPAEEVEWL
ncbi:MAG: dihydroorotate dehydrogenase electron transfer subunit [Gracilibacteraceae bacterium]|jgi:dihydroorotate dehydrogenase electron transfer subunit|nr:dihydroorotate dehydrogenase electron transfer subunit [Gracilibacteraceae bacterium]